MAQLNPEDMLREWMRLSSLERYREFVERQNIPENYEVISGAPLMYIGEKNAKHLIIMLHGGGMVLPLSEGHLEFTYNCFKEMETIGVNAAICCIGYDTVNSKPYPAAIRQAIAAAEHLLSSHEPESISFIGDSMGASIVLSTLLHFSGRIHPSIAPAQLPATRKFFRCALLSPSPPYPSDTGSMQDPDSKDVMTKKMCVDMWAATEKNCEPGVTVPNNWINPQFAPPGWFQNLPISEITLIYGGLEVFRDDIDVIGHKLREDYTGKLTVVRDTAAVHDQFLVELQGMPSTKEYTSGILEWYRQFG